jgi:RimJ/RimL family protein N-acetyltransferase
VGHAAAIPDMRRKDAEYIIFILPDYQNRGLGTALTKLVIDYLRERGLKKVFLEVEADNAMAIRLYRKFRFEFCGQTDDPECIMACSLEHAA